MALSHVEEQHQRALAKLKQETQSEVGSIASTRMSAGNVSLGTDDPVQGSATLQAEALEEWSQLEDKKKDQMRAEAQKLTSCMRSKQVEHEQAITAARARADKATSEAARALFEDEIREEEARHARELQNLEAQASRLPPPPPSHRAFICACFSPLATANAQATESLALIEEEFASSAAKARPPSLRLASSQAGSSQRMSSALVLASQSQSQRTPAPRTEAQRAAISWLDGQERSAFSERQDDPANTLKRQGSKIRIPAKSPAVRVANSPAANRARAMRQAYETLGVNRNVADEDLFRVYAALMQKENPDNHPPELAAYYAKKQKEIRAAYACVQSNRRPSAQLGPPPSMSARGSSFSVSETTQPRAILG